MDLRDVRALFCGVCLSIVSLTDVSAATCSPPASGIVGWWPGEGNANDLVGTNKGTLLGGATANGAGMVGTAFSFDGTNSYVQFADSSVFHPSNLTVEAWIRFSSLDSAGSGGSPAGEQYIIFKQNTRNGTFEGFDLGKERVSGSDRLRFAISSSAGDSVDILSATLVTTGVWYHVAGVRGTNFAQLYVNGQLERQTNVNFAQDYGTLPLFFGTSGQSFWDHKFKGLLDEPALYNRALSSNEIAAIYAAGSAGKCGSPRILAQPQSQTVAVGTNVTFTVTATGTVPLSYQWQFNGAAISGGTVSSLGLTNVQATNAGNYAAVITNSAGTVTSSIASLTVLSPPTITVDPISSTNLAGSTVSLSANATGTLPLVYGWLKSGIAMTNGGRFSGATSNIVTITSLQPSDAADYAFFASNAVGTATSAVANLTVLYAPTITVQPQNLTVTENSNALFTVTVSGSAPLSYQWSFNGNPVSGATNSALSFPAPGSSAGGYFVTITNPVGGVTSSVAILTVISPPVITGDPAGGTNVTGSTVSFAASATGTPPLTYRWLKSGVTVTNGGRFSGANSNILTITNIQSSDAAGYALSVSNAAAVATSAVATLTVLIPPGIVTQPQNLTVTENSNALFTVTANGSAPLSYQWTFNGNSISGGTGSSLSFTAPSSSAGSYAVMVTNAVGAVTSSVATLTVISPPAITSDPAGSTNIAGASVSFIASATGTQPLTYRWLKSGVTMTNGGRLSGANSNILTITNIQSSDAAGYALAVSNTAAVATSAVATLTVLVPPSIVTQPQNLTVLVDSNALFTVTASGTAPLSYQWLFNGDPISGATTSSLTFPAQASDAGNYAVIVTNQAAVATSSVATLTVLVPPKFYTEPVSSTNALGGTAQFSPTVAGTTPLTFQWYFNGIPLTNSARIVGASSNLLSITPLQTNDAGNFWLVATNIGGSGTSSVAQLSVALPPAILTQPANWNVLTGANIALSVTASGTPPLSFQWLHDGADLKDGNGVAGATMPNLSLANVQTNDTGNYTAIVSNIAGIASSAAATVLVTPTSTPPSVTTQPASQILLAGNDATFSVTASGTFPLAYQWRKFGLNLADSGTVSGAASTQLTLHSVALADAGNYEVVISNGGGSITSSVATLAVNPPVLLPVDAVVLVNSTSPRYSDFQRYIQPYLENFGVPYVVQNIATNPVGTNIGSHALIIIGHRALDTNHLYLSSAAQTAISLAVSNGTGLVNFDTDVAAGTSPRYQFIQDIFGFSYGSSGSSNAIVFTNAEPGSPMHYVVAAHTNGETITMRGNISVTGLLLPTNAQPVVLAGGKPLVTVTKYGSGRAVQWGSIDWISVLIMGPTAGLDDTVWRGMVWAGRKPFVLRGFPNLATFRVDDVGGPLWWAHIANEVGFKPFLAVFIDDPIASTRADMSSMVSNGLATWCPHSFDASDMIYFNHQTEKPWSDAAQSNNYNTVNGWMSTNGLPNPKLIATHYSEIGTNAFGGLLNWGVEFCPIEVVPGTIEYTNNNPAPWIVAGPYRYYENPLPGQTNLPMYYCDWLTIPGHPEMSNSFFNCYTEIRDIESCGQWCPLNGDIPGSAARGAALLKRGFDSMVLSTLFTHDWKIQNTPGVGGPTPPMSTNSWRAIMYSITNILAPYKPTFVTLEYGNQYARATKASRLLSSQYDFSSGQLQVTLTGRTDLAISVQIFNGDDNAITNIYGNIPAFTNSVTVPAATVPVAPLLFLGPQNQTNNTGTTAVFPAYAGGSAPLSYRWVKNGTNLLSDGGNVTGASGSVLTISDAGGGDAGVYTLVVSNPFSSVTSAPALFTVIDPLITSQPVSRVNHAGTPALFTVGATGTQLQYQWAKDDLALPTATSASLLLPSVTLTDAGSYSAIVSNAFGAVTSSPATLSVTDPLTIQTIIASNDLNVLQWSAIPGSNYLVQFKDDLAWPDWSNLAIVTATGPSMTITNPPPLPPERFFRILLQ